MKTFEQWFQSEQGVAYDGVYVFAEAAWNASAEDSAEEIAKRDERIASLIAAGAEYQRQFFEQSDQIKELEEQLFAAQDARHRLGHKRDEQAAEISRLKGVISRCKEAMETCCKGVFRDNGFEVSRKDYDSEMVEQALAAIKEEGL